MRIVDSLFRRFRHTRHNHPVFGSMLYMGDRLKYWESKVTFAPTGTVVEVFVDGMADDSMEPQQEFFQMVVQDWRNLREEIGKILLSGWYERNPKVPIDSVWEQFRVSSVSIPSAFTEDVEWEHFLCGFRGRTEGLGDHPKPAIDIHLKTGQ